jgi:thymidylate synthase (FAD)
MKIQLIARPSIIEHGLQSFQEKAREDQLQGSDAERIIETAGRICYDSFGTGRSSSTYHAHIREVGHGSVTEHATFVFHLSGISRNLSLELNRHRVGTAISQRSTRFVDESLTPIVEHPALSAFLMDAAVPEDAKHRVTEACRIAVSESRKAYLEVADALQTWLSGMGESMAIARKQARGAAARYLPNGLETEYVWSCNVREALHIIALRGDRSADAEIRAFAVQLAKVLAEEVPAYFADIAIEEYPEGPCATNVRTV